jgi:hypothetical protein
MQPSRPERAVRELLAYSLADGGAYLYLACAPRQAAGRKPSAARNQTGAAHKAPTHSTTQVPAAAWSCGEHPADSSIYLRHLSLPLCPSLPPLGALMAAPQAPPGLLGPVAHVHAPLWAAQRVCLASLPPSRGEESAVMAAVGRGDGTLWIVHVLAEAAFSLPCNGMRRIWDFNAELSIARKADDAALERARLAGAVLPPSFFTRIAPALGASQSDLPLGAWPSSVVAEVAIRGEVEKPPVQRAVGSSRRGGRGSLGKAPGRARGAGGKTRAAGSKRPRRCADSSSSSESADTESTTSSSGNESEARDMDIVQDAAGCHYGEGDDNERLLQTLLMDAPEEATLEVTSNDFGGADEGCSL